MSETFKITDLKMDRSNTLNPKNIEMQDFKGNWRCVERIFCHEQGWLVWYVVDKEFRTIANTREAVERARFRYTTYEGWVNRETWAVALWLDNDYELYQRKCKIVTEHKNKHVSFLASALRKFVFSRTIGEIPLHMSEGAKGMIEDIDGEENFNKVDWQEIAQNYLLDEIRLPELPDAHYVGCSTLCVRGWNRGH